MFEGTLGSLHYPTKLVPWAEQICLTGPRMDVKSLRALMKLEVWSDSITSICTAMILVQTNVTAHLCYCNLRLLQRRVMIDQEPDMSRPTFVKAGSVLRQSAGRVGHLIKLRCATKFRPHDTLVNNTAYLFSPTNIHMSA